MEHEVDMNIKLQIAELLPNWLVYWCAVRVVAHATTGEYSSQVVPELAAMDALHRWETDRLGYECTNHAHDPNR